MAEATVVVSGANGFIGQAFLEHCVANSKLELRGVVRRADVDLPRGVELICVPALTDQTGWTKAMRGADVVVHTAARVHQMRKPDTDPRVVFRRVNVDATLALARAAVGVGVRRFVYLSSIKVNGESTLPGRPFRIDDPPAPVDAYAISKNEAELGLQEISVQTGMEVVVIRPVLVYGPRVRANFLRMMRAIHRGIPLPLGSIMNARSLVAIDNLVDMMATCVAHPSAANRTFFVSDGEDLSTTELLRRIAAALGRPPRLVRVPQRVVEGLLRLAGKGELADRICGFLQVDISATEHVLGWRPRMSVNDALARTAEYYLSSRHVKQS